VKNYAIVYCALCQHRIGDARRLLHIQDHLAQMCVVSSLLGSIFALTR
jgi:hypothetical protein